MRTILGLDPGETTGFVLLKDGKPSLSGQIEFKDGEVGERLELLIVQADGIGMERYTISPRTSKLTRQYEALYVIGIVLFLARRMGKPVRLQTPADAKNAYSNIYLRELGLFDSVTGPHARDALRHALLADRMMTNLH